MFCMKADNGFHGQPVRISIEKGCMGDFHTEHIIIAMTKCVTLGYSMIQKSQVGELLFVIQKIMKMIYKRYKVGVSITP